MTVLPLLLARCVVQLARLPLVCAVVMGMCACVYECVYVCVCVGVCVRVRV